MNINLTLLMQAVAFFAFILFTAKFIWPPLMRAIETRQKQIADGLAAGEEGRHSLVNAEKRIAEMMEEAKIRASDIVAQGEKLVRETGGLLKPEEFQHWRLLHGPVTPYTRERWDDTYRWTVKWNMTVPGATYENTVDNRAWQ